MLPLREPAPCPHLPQPPVIPVTPRDRTTPTHLPQCNTPYSSTQTDVCITPRPKPISARKIKHKNSDCHGNVRGGVLLELYTDTTVN